MRIAHRLRQYWQRVSISTSNGNSEESWLIAEDTQKKTVLWRIKVGTKPDNAGPYWQSAMLNFSDISIGPGEDRLTIVDYLGRHFLVDLRTRSATPHNPSLPGTQTDPFEPPLAPLPPGFPL